MFDIGFSELLLVAVVALVVIGPERLPGVARNIGQLTGRLQRYVHDIKRDFNREVEFEEIRRIQQEMESTVQSMQESMRVVESTLKHEVGRHQTGTAEVSPAPTVAEIAEVTAKESPALTKPRNRKKPDTQVAHSAPAAHPTVAPAPDDEQFRLF
jgi:sec-independent protein translocase protein TatB